jgi:hypothetical protein
MSDTRNLRPHQVVGYDWVPPNLLINGDFEIWQRGSGPFTISNRYTADEWILAASTPATVTNTGTSLQLVGSASSPWVGQGIECYKSLEGLTLSFSADVLSSSPSTQLYISDWQSGIPQAVGANHPGDSLWHRITTIKQIRTGLTSSASWPHALGMIAYITTPGTAEFKNAMLVVGNYPEGVPFVPANPTEDLLKCQRFYEIGSNDYRSYGTAGTSAHMTQPYRSTKYATPTVTGSFTPALGGASGSVGTSLNTLEGMRCTMVNGGSAGDFAGTFTWISEVP